MRCSGWTGGSNTASSLDEDNIAILLWRERLAAKTRYTIQDAQNAFLPSSVEILLDVKGKRGDDDATWSLARKVTILS